MARRRRDLQPEDAARVVALEEAEADAVVSHLRLRLIPATTSEETRARFERAARKVTRSDAFDELPSTQQLELLLAVFDELGLGEQMRQRADRCGGVARVAGGA